MFSKKCWVGVLSLTVFMAMAGTGWAAAVPEKMVRPPVPSQPVAAPAPSQPVAPPVSPQPVAASRDPRALDMLKLMSDKLSQAKSLRFQARSMAPIKSPAGMWVSLYGTSRVVKEGSDKLFAETRGDFFPYDLYFDGKTITEYSPAKNLYAEKAAPGTVDSVIEQAYREEGKSFPYADILRAQPYDLLTEGLVSAVYVGQSTFRPLSGAANVKADHLVFSNKGVEWQIWIGTEDRLPRLVCATYLDNVGEPSYIVEFGDWQIDEPVPPETFVFQNATQAAKVEFRNPVQQGREVPSGAADQQQREEPDHEKQ
jgi:hypothetical protein